MTELASLTDRVEQGPLAPGQTVVRPDVDLTIGTGSAWRPAIGDGVTNHFEMLASGFDPSLHKKSRLFAPGSLIGGAQNGEVSPAVKDQIELFTKASSFHRLGLSTNQILGTLPSSLRTFLQMQ